MNDRIDTVLPRCKKSSTEEAEPIRAKLRRESELAIPRPVKSRIDIDDPNLMQFNMVTLLPNLANARSEIELPR